MFLPSLPGASYSSENPSYEYPPHNLLFLFLREGKIKESRDIGEFPVNGTSPMIGAQDEEKRIANFRLLMLGFLSVRVVNADVVIAIGTFTHVSILSSSAYSPPSRVLIHSLHRLTLRHSKVATFPLRTCHFRLHFQFFFFFNYYYFRCGLIGFF